MHVKMCKDNGDTIFLQISHGQWRHKQFTLFLKYQHFQDAVLSAPLTLLSHVRYLMIQTSNICGQVCNSNQRILTILITIQQTSWAEQSHTQDFLQVFLGISPIKMSLSLFRLSPMKVFFILSLESFVWLPQLQLKIWVRSNQWLLRYSTLIILRSSSVVFKIKQFGQESFKFG